MVLQDEAQRVQCTHFALFRFVLVCGGWVWVLSWASRLARCDLSGLAPDARQAGESQERGGLEAAVFTQTYDRPFFVTFRESLLQGPCRCSEGRPECPPGPARPAVRPPPPSVERLCAEARCRRVRARKKVEQKHKRKSFDQVCRQGTSGSNGRAGMFERPREGRSGFWLSRW